MSIFQQKFLIFDQGTHTIKGLLCETGPISEHIVRTEALPVARIEEEMLRDTQLEEEDTEWPEAQTETEDGKATKNDVSFYNWNKYEYNTIRFLQSFFPEETSYILSLPLDNLHIRDFMLPLMKPKEANESIAFGTEESLPYSLEKTEVIGHTWAEDEENMHIISFGASRDFVENFVRPLVAEQAVVLGLYPDASMVACFLRVFGLEFYEKKSIGQLDIGATHTIFNVVYDGKLAFTRSLPYGGNDLDEVIASYLGIEIHLAEEKRLQWDMNLLDVRPRSLEFYNKNSISKVAYDDVLSKCRDWLYEICIEVDRSLLALRCVSPDCYYVSGGVSLTQGLSTLIGEKLQKNVERYPLALENNEPPEIWVTAIGARELYKLSREARDDFIDTPFGSTLKGGQIHLGLFKMPLFFAMASLLIFSLSFAIGIFQDYNRSKRYIEEIEVLSKNIPGILASDAAPSQILIQTQEICRRRFRGFQASQKRVLDLIQEINQHIPPPEKMDVVFQKLDYDGKAIHLEVELSNVGQSSNLQEELSKSRIFTIVEVKQRKILPNQRAKVTYRLESLQKKPSSSLATRETGCL